MKKLLVICGTGIATSTVVMEKIKAWLEKNHLVNSVKLYQSKVADEVNRIDEYDVIISTTLVPDHMKSKVIDGIPLITGFGTEELFHELENRLKE